MWCADDPLLCARRWCPREVGAGRLVVCGMRGDRTRCTNPHKAIRKARRLRIAAKVPGTCTKIPPTKKIATRWICRTIISLWKKIPPRAGTVKICPRGLGTGVARYVPGDVSIGKIAPVPILHRGVWGYKLFPSISILYRYFVERLTEWKDFCLEII